jgi:hypothetical protein
MTTETEKRIAWRQRLKDDNFYALLRLSGSSQPAFPAAQHGLRCLRCKIGTPLSDCDNCGGTVWRLGHNADGVVGLFCSRCNQGLTRWSCADCGTDNPISPATFVVRPGVGGRGCGLSVWALGILLLVVMCVVLLAALLLV